MKITRETRGTASVTLYDLEPTPDRFCDDVVAGLTGSPRKLPPKYFYDAEGARLFERITQLDAYYPTRVEVGILESNADAIAQRIGPRASIVEFGSGSGEKTWILLRNLDDPAAYVPVDISRAQLVDFALQVAEAFPGMRVIPVCADYTTTFPLPPLDGTDGQPVAFFPGSTLGNFEPAEAELFLTRVRELVGDEGRLLLGLDLRKSPSIIEPAYDDPEGVTALFNLNLLSRINRECGGSFDLSAFRHQAFYDTEHGRIEMRLVSERDQTVRISCDADGEPVMVRFRQGEFITTEYSHKFDFDEFASTAARAGWSILDRWTDPREWFAILLLG